MRRVRSAHVWGQSPAESGVDNRFRLFSANLAGSMDMSGDCPPTRPEETL